MAGEDAAGAGTKGWGQAASQLMEARPGGGRAERCRALVDELERVADPGKASRMLSGLLADLGHAACAKVLAESIERMYVTPGNCGALGDLFGEIGKSAHGRMRTHVTLEAVRVSLLCAYARAGELGESAKAVMGSCHDALEGVASHYKLGILSGRMRGRGAKAAICAGAHPMAGMARLWRFTHDMCDAPDNAVASSVLERYGALGAMASKERLDRAGPRLTQFVQNMALDHIMHEDCEDVYAAADESNMRIRYWLDVVYGQHGVDSNLCSLDRPPKSAFQKPSLEWVNLVVGVRHLILELSSFSHLERLAHKKIVKRLDAKNPDTLYEMLDGHEETAEVIGLLRCKFGAHIHWTFNEVKEAVDEIGLASIVGYAKRVLLFEDAAYRTIRHKYHCRKTSDCELIKHTPLVGERERLAKIKEKYGPVRIALSVKSVDDWHAIHESYLCLHMTYGKYLESTHGDGTTVDEIKQATSEIYNLKYIFLHMCNIIQKLQKPALSMPFEPEFASRESGYCRLRDDYSAHLHINKIKDLRQILKTDKNLISNIP